MLGASSSGISLHAGHDMACTNRRLHITLELAWSAETQLQFFGRTHRTNQMSSPRYELLCTDSPGEQRFVSAVTSRLEMLGALVRGGRDSASIISGITSIDNPKGFARSFVSK